MDLRTPHHLGGDRYVASVTVGRCESDTVRDCPTCGGYCYDDEWHLRTTVRRSGGETTVFHHCGEDCLREWLRLCAGR